MPCFRISRPARSAIDAVRRRRDELIAELRQGVRGRATCRAQAYQTADQAIRTEDESR